jgi:hypothetical protein
MHNIIYDISVIIMLRSGLKNLLILVVIARNIISIKFLLGWSCFLEASCWDVLQYVLVFPSGFSVIQYF